MPRASGVGLAGDSEPYSLYLSPKDWWNRHYFMIFFNVIMTILLYS